MNLLKKIIPESIKKYIKSSSGAPDQRSSFMRLKDLGFNPKTILDIGAYEGNWAIEIHSLFPQANILLIEGQANKQKLLIEKVKSIPNAIVQIALLGADMKEVDFNIYETASSVFKEDNETGAQIEKVQLQLLDNLIKNTKFEYPDLIKLDTQGYELEILKGGIKTLAHANAVLMEVSLLGIYNEAPLVDEVMSFMKANGFVLYDICSLIRRPYDNALYQSDFLFVKKNNQFRASTRWI